MFCKVGGWSPIARLSFGKAAAPIGNSASSWRHAAALQRRTGRFDGFCQLAMSLLAAICEFASGGGQRLR